MKPILVGRRPKRKSRSGMPHLRPENEKLPGSLDALSVGEFHHNLDGGTHGFPEFFPIFHTEFSRIDTVGQCLGRPSRISCQVGFGNTGVGTGHVDQLLYGHCSSPHLNYIGNHVFRQCKQIFLHEFANKNIDIIHENMYNQTIETTQRRYTR